MDNPRTLADQAARRRAAEIRTPTRTQLRRYYLDQGYEVRIDIKGHVTFKLPDDVYWLDGRFITEYRNIDGYIVLT